MKTTQATTSILLFILLIFNGCGISKLLTGEDEVYFPGTVVLKNGTNKTGFFAIPNADSEQISLYSQDKGMGKMESISAIDVDVLKLYNAASPQQKAIFEYLTVKPAIGKATNRWVFQLSKEEYLAAYIGASQYTIATNGKVLLLGTTQVIQHGAGRGTTVIQPSFPVYMVKKNEKVLTMVGVKGGISFEGSSLRSGITNFLKDDPSLCEYIRDRKFEFDNIEHIVSLYNPNRGDAPLLVNGKEIIIEKTFITNHFDKELLYLLEVGKPFDDRYSGEISLGIRSSAYKFISYGGDIGIARFKNVDNEKFIVNHPAHTVQGGWENVPVLPEDLSNKTHFRINTYLGAQLPMNLGKIYLLPAAHISLGGLFGSDYGAMNYGPMLNLDLGFSLKNGSILLLGGGYRHSIPIVSEDTRLQGTYKEFDTYEPIKTVFVHIGYKF